MNEKKFCPYCGNSLVIKFTEGRDRFFCSTCNEPLYENPVPVAACVVFNAQDQVLLVKRSVDPKKGEWCLPGGFVELDESAEQAALRELHEETGLTGNRNRLINIFLTESEQYTSVLMIGYLIGSVHGVLEAGDDSDEAAYFDLTTMPGLAFQSHRFILDEVLKEKTAGMNRDDKPAVLSNIGAYVITSGDHCLLAEQACRAGARLVQYRDKQVSCKNFLAQARIIREITARYNTIFIVNDHLDCALAADADGVHLGQQDIPLKDARKITPSDFIIGISTHSVPQALAAEQSGADYIAIGPVFKTPTKESYTPVGLNTVRQVLQEVAIPVVAIGGINMENLSQVKKTGIKNAAMVRQFRQNTAATVRQVNSLLLKS
ncbi:MAG: thiamine phosphate synthase [Spirochaetales bacterium]|nr:thiamine phosphate synthase [Spirochaetales bacterium]